ncbi:hypothetical protein J6590_004122 [Homalodisca vitripennis]|nr:hypothetical protein J6590_004122 [Homalodisca vitripennis]
MKQEKQGGLTIDIGATMWCRGSGAMGVKARHILYTDRDFYSTRSGDTRAWPRRGETRASPESVKWREPVLQTVVLSHRLAECDM